VTRRPATVTVVGDTLLDVDWVGTVDRVCPDAPVPVLEAGDQRFRPGGAGLAARCAAKAGAAVTLVTALGSDDAGARLREELTAAGVAVVDLGLDGPTPVKLRLRAGGQSLVRVDHGCSPVVVPRSWTPDATAAVEQGSALLVSDYGRGLAAMAAFRAVVQTLAHRADGGAPVVWDPHRAGPEPPAGLDVLVPNLQEARRLAGCDADLGTLAEALAERFDAAVAVTLGDRGALVARPGGATEVVPVEPVAGDTCGAGDRFAATIAVERARGHELLDAVRRAVAAARDQVLGTWADGGTSAWGPQTSGALPVPVPRPSGATSQDDRMRDPLAWATALRSAGGRLVAAGGCFDVLHAGHVRLLESARRLGDGLVVCLNGDLSVRRLKGRHRPVNPVEDRAAVLAGLTCVDAVVVFDEDTPCEVLRRLRPDVFAKGADYAGDDLPERAVLAEWGGELVLLPVVDGRSTTRILEAAAAYAAG
jgi:D-beta-D-heptose 7-phosphate kinase / D-beta-D-heptose 1-phosphate adenosyltransferase